MKTPTGGDYDLRLTRNNSAKELISKYAADCIPNNSTVFISVGTTMETFARIMKDKKNMRYITNSIFIAGILRQNPENEIFLPSGRLNNSVSQQTPGDHCPLFSR